MVLWLHYYCGIIFNKMLIDIIDVIIVPIIINYYIIITVPLEELGDATIEESALLFEEGNSITVDWNPSDILRSVGSVTDINDIELDVKLIEIDQNMREIAILASNIPNSGSATVIIDGLDLTDSDVYQVSVFIEAHSIGTPNNKRQIGTLLRGGVWTGIIFVSLSGIGRFLCDQWASTEPISIGQEILDRVRSRFPCPPTLAQAERSDSNLQLDNRLIFFYHPDAENCFRQIDGTE